MSAGDEGSRRLAAYSVLCSHYRRWLAHSVRTELGFVAERTDEELDAVPARTWRVVADALVRDADQADRECMAVWHVPIDRLDEFVRVRTHPELEGLMKEQFNMVWHPHFHNWVEAP